MLFISWLAQFIPSVICVYHNIRVSVISVHRRPYFFNSLFHQQTHLVIESSMPWSNSLPVFIIFYKISLRIHFSLFIFLRNSFYFLEYWWNVTTGFSFQGLPAVCPGKTLSGKPCNIVKLCNFQSLGIISWAVSKNWYWSRFCFLIRLVIVVVQNLGSSMLCNTTYTSFYFSLPFSHQLYHEPFILVLLIF